MKKYAIITYHTLDDYFEQIFDTYEEAEATADKEWQSMSESDKALIEFYDIMHGEYSPEEGFCLPFADSLKSYK